MRRHVNSCLVLHDAKYQMGWLLQNLRKRGRRRQEPPERPRVEVFGLDDDIDLSGLVEAALHDGSDSGDELPSASPSGRSSGFSGVR